MKFTHKFLTSDHADQVARLVSDAFVRYRNNADQNIKEDIFPGFLRLLGFETKKIEAIVVNALIVIAELVRLFCLHLLFSKLLRLK